ncbi:MAG: DUF885 domain-containing protein [Dokdonella sp.]
MHRLLIAAAICGGLSLPVVAAEPATAGTQASTEAAVNPADKQFADLSAQAVDGSMRLSPVSATQIGDHRFDSELDDLSAKGRAASLKFSRDMLAKLENIDVSKLSRANQVDAGILRNQLKYDIWTTETLQSWAWDPQVYSQLAGGALFTLMAREYAPLPDRLRAATARMRKLPTLFAQMRANLDPARVPRIHAETVAKQNKGVLSIIDGMILPQAKELPEADRKQLEAAAAALRKSVAENQLWLDKNLVPKAKGDFRIGKKLYDQKLAFALNSPLSREDIRTRAEAELTRVRAQMYGISRTALAGKADVPPLPEKPTAEQQQAAIVAALAIASTDHPARADVVETAKHELALATDFVRSKDLITLPDSPVEVILMPEFARGVSIAYCDSPGPLDKGEKTFYAVSPIPDDWTDQQVDSFLREYNTRSIAELSVHEAMPGHYVQLWHSNKYPSTLRAVLGSGSFIEGWAVYAEKMMVDQGFMDGDPLYHLVQLKWYLRALANAIIDQGIQVDGMTRDAAMKLMTEQTFQEEREAALKWVRAQLTSAQLPSYFVGVQEHLDLNREVQKRWGKDYSTKRYNDAVLSYGSPPVRYVRELMLDLPIE